MHALLTLKPQLSPCLSSFSPPSSFLFSFRPHKRFHFLTPCSSLKQSKKQTLQKISSTPPQSFKWLFSSPKSDDGGENNDGDEEGSEDETALKGTILAGVLLVGFVGGFAAGGYFYKDQINSFLSQFSTFIEGSFSDFCTFLRFYFNSSWLLLIWLRNSSLFGSYFSENSVSLEFLMRIYGSYR